MATCIWTGQAVADNDWGDAANWDTGVPGAGDTVIFDGLADDGDQNCTVNIALAATNLARLEVHGTYTGTIGASGSYLIISADRVLLNPGGDLYLDSGGTDSLDTVIVTGTASGKAIYLKGDITYMYAYGGTITYTSAAGDDLSNAYLQQKTGGTLLFTATGAAGTVSTLAVWGGTATCTDTITVTQTYAHDGTTTFSDDSVATNVILITDSPTVNWKATATLASLTVFGGTFDASGDMKTKTITNSKMYGNGTMNLANGCNNITLTNPVQMFGFKSPTVDYISTVALAEL